MSSDLDLPRMKEILDQLQLQIGDLQRDVHTLNTNKVISDGVYQEIDLTNKSVVELDEYVKGSITNSISTNSGWILGHSETIGWMRILMTIVYVFIFYMIFFG